MFLKKVTVHQALKKTPRKFRQHKAKVCDVISQFMSSGEFIMQVVDIDHEFYNASDMRRIFCNTIKEQHYPVSCFINDGKVFLCVDKIRMK